MSHDWPWTAVVALAIPAGLGHLCHFILSINVTSGLGCREAALGRIRLVLLAVFTLSTGLLLWEHLRSPWPTWTWLPWGYAALCAITGVVLLPLATLALSLRRPPRGITRAATAREIGLAGPEGRDELIGAGAHSRLLRLPGNDAFRLRLHEWDVQVPGLPGPLDGLRIVQLTDLHMAHSFRPSYFERVVDACRGWDADLILLTGDVVEEESAIPWIEPLLGPLEARLGKLAVLGNHDEEHDPQAVVRALARAGFETLEGRWTALDADGSMLAVGGTSAPWGPDVAPDEMPPADFRILLSHSPDRFYRAARWGVDLMLSGHNHGGQIRLPMVGAVFMPSVYSRRFDRGFFRRGRTLLYVSEGVAGKHPARYGCPPEVTRFVLRPAPAGSLASGRATAHGHTRPARETDWARG